jgi:signal transduction histidine kinase/DNA-binding response OmpR family regulator
LTEGNVVQDSALRAVKTSSLLPYLLAGAVGSAAIGLAWWVAVARIDQAEALRPLGGYAATLTAVGGGLVATLGLALAWLRRYQVSQFYRQQYEAEADRRRLEDAHDQDRRRLEEQLRESQKLESVGRLAGGVAHDFNNLLTVINGYSDLLASRLVKDPEHHDLAVQVLKAGERAAALTQQLLAFSRKQVIQPRVLSLNALVLDAELMLSRLVGDAIELVIENGASPDRVVADPGQLHQVIVNLAVNARDAMPDGGRLTLETLTLPTLAPDGAPGGGDGTGGASAHASAYTVVLRMSDTGLGMDDAVQARIFEPFFTTKTAGRGTGLGLATVYGIVKQSDGVLRVTSAPGAGTAIEVHLPGTDAPLAPESRPARRLLHRGTETLLVVDDRHDVRRFVARSLRGYGYRVLEAASGQEAINASDAHPEPIDLLLTDVVMPGLNGRQLAERLRQHRPDLTVLYMSGYSDNVLGEHGVLDAGMSYIQKPFTPDDLAVKIRATLRRLDGPQRLLVVDDEPAIRALLQQLLAPSGCDVLLAADAVEALEIVTGIDRLDVIVIDLAALEPNGVEPNGTDMIATFRTAMPAIKIVVMSGAFGADWRAAIGPAGVDAILAKPIDHARLFEVLQDLAARAAT